MRRDKGFILTMLAATLNKHEKAPVIPKYSTILACSFLLGMIVAWMIVNAVLPLRGLFFPSAQLVPLNSFLLLPSHILFPGNELTPFLSPNIKNVPFPPFVESWSGTASLLGSFILLFFCYLFALKYLPQRVSIRYIVLSACLLGGVCVLNAVVTSPDLFSYIMYARMWTLYHLNPLATSPSVVPKDAVYQYLYWKNQPSAYGPTWLLLSSFLQWSTTLVFKTNTISAMIISLRLLGLGAHLWSTLLVWSIGGSLQRLNGVDRPRIRVLATLAFAWNPLLLFEACVNAHNDTVMLLLILLGLWLLVRQTSLPSFVGIAVLFALATCLKANAALLVPGLLIFAWLQPRSRHMVGIVLLAYLGTVLVLYAPFWQDGAILKLLSTNPGTYRNINTLPDFIGQWFNVVWHLFGYPLQPEIGSPAEHVTHVLSEVLFTLAYAYLCWQALCTSRRLHTPLHLMRWLTTAWFLYCLLGSPWFWPWYAVTFFGLFALVEASATERTAVWNMVENTLAFRVFAFVLLSAYCFAVSGVHESFIPLLPGFRWAYLRGLWIWIPVLLLLLLEFRRGLIASAHQAPTDGL